MIDWKMGIPKSESNTFNHNMVQMLCLKKRVNRHGSVSHCQQNWMSSQFSVIKYIQDLHLISLIS